ncbi:MAG: gliding motility-associated C-terminal domain-containing protein [Bacteroidota bacterium]
MRQLIFAILFVLGNLLTCPLDAQELPLLSLEKKEAILGDTVQVCLSVANFSDVLSLQFSISWDASILTYLSVEDFNLPGASATNFAEGLAPQGNLPFVWFDAGGQGVVLADSTALFCLQFLVNGNIGDSSLVRITNDPTPLQLGQLVDDNIQGLTPDVRAGCVQIVNSSLSVNIETTDNDCLGGSNGSVRLSVEGGMPPYQYDWSGPGNFQSNTANLEQLFSGPYVLQIQDALGESFLDTIFINDPSDPLRIDNIEINQPDCEEDNGQISIRLSGGNQPYQFDFGAGATMGSTQDGLAAGDYLIMVEDATACIIDTLVSLEDPTGNLGAILPETASFCVGDSIVLEAPEDLMNYQWSLAGQALSQGNSSLVVRAEGTYSLDASTTDGCPVRATTNVQAVSSEGMINGDTIVELGSFTTLTAGAGSNYIWTPAASLSCTDCRSPMAIPTDSTLYQVSYISEEECPVMASFLLRVEFPEDVLRFEPTTFISPNGDGDNDFLEFPGLETYQANEIKIYSRWGQIVYSKVNYQIEGALWDGTLRGEPLPPGIYYYVLRVNEQELFVRQTLTLIRE